MEAGERGFLSDFGGAKTNRHLFRAAAPRPTARGRESCSGRLRRGIIGKSTGYFRGQPRQNPKEILCVHVLRTAGGGGGLVVRGAASPENLGVISAGEPVKNRKECPASTSCGQRASGTDGRHVLRTAGGGRRSFPQCGKSFSIVWKNGGKFFHCVDKRGGGDQAHGGERRKVRVSRAARRPAAAVTQWREPMGGRRRPRM